MKIVNKISLMYIVLGFIVIIITRTMSYVATRDLMEKQIYRNLNVIAHEKSEAVEVYLEELKVNTEILSKYFIHESILNDIDSLGSSDVLENAVSEYSKIARTDNDVYEVFVMDIKGKIIVSSDKTRVGLDRSKDEYFLKGREGFHQKKVYFSSTTKRPTFTVSMPVYSKEDETKKIGVIVQRISLERLNKIVQCHEFLGNTGEAYIINDGGYMVTPSRFRKNTFLKTKVQRNIMETISKGEHGAVKGRSENADMHFYKNYRNVDVVGVKRKIPGTEWTMLVEMDKKEIFAPLRKILNNFILLLVSSPFLIWFVGRFAGKVIEKPMERFVEGVEKIGQGDLEYRFDDSVKDELGVLAAAFNRTLENLKNTMTTKDELAKVNKELDGFVHTASHDLRAPLRGISSFATFLEEDYNDKIDERGKDYINEIRKGAGRMSALIEDLLKLSRVSRIKNPYEQVNIGRLVNEAVSNLEFEIKENNAEIIVPVDLPDVFCDPIKMRELFLNLINNGVKFSSKDNVERPRVEVGYADKGSEHEFFVKDNGIGIEKKYHEKIFESFQRLHTDSQYEGTGVGLNLVQRIVEEHHGKLWVESNSGEGAVFYFTIPKDLVG